SFPYARCDKLYMLIKVKFIPGQHHDTLEAYHGPRVCLRIVHNLVAAVPHPARVRASALPVGLTLSENLTQERRLPNVSRGAGDSTLLEGSSKSICAARYRFWINHNCILPVGMCRPRQGQGYGHARDVA